MHIHFTFSAFSRLTKILLYKITRSQSFCFLSLEKWIWTKNKLEEKNRKFSSRQPSVVTLSSFCYGIVCILHAIWKVIRLTFRYMTSCITIFWLIDTLQGVLKSKVLGLLKEWKLLKIIIARSVFLCKPPMMPPPKPPVIPYSFMNECFRLW